jgi:hypothetical protein
VQRTVFGPALQDQRACRHLGVDAVRRADGRGQQPRRAHPQPWRWGSDAAVAVELVHRRQRRRAHATLMRDEVRRREAAPQGRRQDAARTRADDHVDVL